MEKFLRLKEKILANGRHADGRVVMENGQARFVLEDGGPGFSGEMIHFVSGRDRLYIRSDDPDENALSRAESAFGLAFGVSGLL